MEYFGLQRSDVDDGGTGLFDESAGNIGGGIEIDGDDLYLLKLGELSHLNHMFQII